MSFDRDRVVAEIEKRLAGVTLPNSSASLVSAGCIHRVIARDGAVSLILAFPPQTPGRDTLRAEVERLVNDIDGVESVQILEKSTPAPEAGAAPTAPPKSGVPGVRNLFAVASGKGGVGKSTVAVNLAVALAKKGRRVGLLDADVYGPSVPKMLGLEGAQPRVTPDERLLPLEAHGVRTMSIGFMLEEDSPVIWRGPMVTGLLRQFLAQVEWGELDDLVIDLPPGTGDAQLTLTQSIALSCGIIVTTPQDVALLDVQRGIQMFQRVEVPIFGIVENMSAFRCPKCGHVEDIFTTDGGREAAKRYGVPFLGAIPIEKNYAVAGDSGAPVVVSHPESEFARVLGDIAQRVIDQFPSA